MSKYDDILYSARPKSNHMKMSMELRAAIFMPFAALTGYEEALLEEERILDKKKVLDTDREEEINDKLLNIDLESIYDIVYFKRDLKKDGGNYLKIRGMIKKIDLDNRSIILLGEVKINLEDIYDIKKVS